MTERVKKLYTMLKDESYKTKRREVQKKSRPVLFGLDTLTAGEYTENFRLFLSDELPVLFDNDRFGFHRSTTPRSPVGNGNVTPDYGKILCYGFDPVIAQITGSLQNDPDPNKQAFGKAMLDCLEIVYDKCDAYKAYAKDKGCTELYNALCNVPRKGATSVYEALVCLNLCIFFLRCASHTHMTLGRFDVYMLPFYEMDKKRGVSDEEIFALVEEFFIMLNLDTDLYHGMQVGDNGQSMVLGGFDKDGNAMYNALTDMCMKASLELCVIDPKINLRVGKNTPPELYVTGTHLTKAGLGFPQYCNDDVIVPGLIKLGYTEEDAYNYSLAACWETIIPGRGADYPNIDVMDFPKVVGDSIRENLETSESYEALWASVRESIDAECKIIIDRHFAHREPSSPFLSVFFDGCTESLTDLFAGGAKYQNYGCHGAGIAVAADSLSAVKKVIYDTKSVSKKDLLLALDRNFEGFTELRNTLLACPKMGNGDDYVDSIAAELVGAFAGSLSGKDNGHGGVWRAGTGSAMEYIRKGEVCPATPDGRFASDPYPSSFTPSMDARPDGILSVIRSFTSFDLTDIINGGPLTLEIHDTVLRNEIGIEKTASLVKAFIDRGGHQLQLNAINRDRLLDAIAHPELHKNLIVRVWGWSGYFNELDTPYKEHIIHRVEYMG